MRTTQDDRQDVEAGIVAQRDRGRSVTRIAQYFGLTRDDVRAVLAKAEGQALRATEQPAGEATGEVAQAVADALLSRFGLMPSDVADMTDDELLSVRGLGEKSVEAIRQVYPEQPPLEPTMLVEVADDSETAAD